MNPGTYLAMEVVAAGRLRACRRPRQPPAAGEVVLQVEACGICGADRTDVERDAAVGARRVPGHEVIGRIIGIGAQVPARWALGQRVGVGRLGGPCLQCDACRNGRFALCGDQPVTGVSRDGGYAELMHVRASGLVAVPATLDSVHAAPLLCAGLATYNALRRCGAAPGERIAIHGIGGLGHMAVQYARRMGFHVVAIGRGQALADDAQALGAHAFIDAAGGDASARLQALGGVRAIITTVGDPQAVQALLPALLPGGTLVVLGVGTTPLAVGSGYLVGGERTLLGTLTGSPADGERALHFSALSLALPWVQQVPLQEADSALQRLREGTPRFRLVLVPPAATPRPA